MEYTIEIEVVPVDACPFMFPADVEEFMVEFEEDEYLPDPPEVIIIEEF